MSLKPRYYLCPECEGGSADLDQEDEYQEPPCPRCNRRGSLPADRMTDEEIEAAERRIRDDDELRNFVDFTP